METRLCGRSGLRVPVLGVGCWSFGGGSYWGKQHQRDVDAVVSAAIERGCALFDTAEAYNDGRSEEALGRALRGRRDRAIIGSKILPANCAPDLIPARCEASLRRLETDYLDLYMIHWPLAEPALGQALRALEALRLQGKIRHIGVSNFGPRQLGDVAASGLAVAADQLPYSLLSRAIEWEILPLCDQRGVGVLGYMPLMQGLLTGQYSRADDLPAARARTRHFSGSRPGSRHGEPGLERETFDAIAALRDIARRAGERMERLALAWSMARPGVSASITGARNAAQLHANADAAEMTIPADLLGELDRATEPLKQAMGRAVDLFNPSSESRTF